MPDCPDPAACGYEPITTQCIDCMRGMPMPSCPHPDVCPDSAFPSNSASCMMQTVFETSNDVCVFLASWHVTSGGQWFALSIGVFLGALFREWLLVHRQHRARSQRRSGAKTQASLPLGHMEKFASPLLDSAAHSPALSPPATQRHGDALNCLIGSGYYSLTLVLAYLLMLLIMTYNIAVFALVVISSALANFICSYGMLSYWRRHVVVRHVDDGETVTSANGGTDDMETKLQQDPCCADLDLGEESR